MKRDLTILAVCVGLSLVAGALQYRAPVKAWAKPQPAATPPPEFPPPDCVPPKVC
jgi:hypothetical protein